MLKFKRMRKLWKTIKILVLTSASIFFVCFLSIVAFGQLKRPVYKADAIIVLGAAVNTPAVFNRSMQGLYLYEHGDAPVIILAGGVDYPGAMPEAEYMRQVILQKNPSLKDKLILDVNSHSTFQNIENAIKLYPQMKSVIIVSDSYHLARGEAVAKVLGLGPVYTSAPDTSGYYSYGQLFYHYLREAAAMISYVPQFVLRKSIY